MLEIEPRALSKYYNIEVGPQNSFYFLFETGLELTQTNLDLTILLLSLPSSWNGKRVPLRSVLAFF